MAKEKRTPRTYKATDDVYKKSMRRAKKDKIKLSNIIENVVKAYSAGMDIKAVKVTGNTGHALDIFSENFSVRLNELKQIL